ncbi:MAG: hypothetical protein K6G52_09075 [Treponemataceae bacterium]|nr:hypothetical protein [Treponemataceae bacterium]
MKKILYISAILVLMMSIVGCATTVSYTVDRPAELDLNGAKTIAILPIQAEANNSSSGEAYFLSWLFGRPYRTTNTERNEMANFFTENLTMSLLDSGYFTVIGASQVSGAISNGNKAPCDVYLTGYISDWSTGVDSEYRQNSDGETVLYQKRTASVTYVYQVIDSTTNGIVSQKSKKIEKNTGWVNSNSTLQSATSLLQGGTRDLVKDIMKQLQPYSVTQSVVLADAPEKNENFAACLDMAKRHLYDRAIEEFDNLYKTTGIIEACYNEALLKIVIGDYEQAVSLLNEVIASPNAGKLVKKANNAKNNALNEISYQKKLQRQLDARN